MHKVNITLFTICSIYNVSKHIMPRSSHYWIMMLTSLPKVLPTSFELLKCKERLIERYIENNTWAYIDKYMEFLF